MTNINEIIKVLNLAKLKIIKIYQPNNYFETIRYFAVESFFEPMNQTPHYQVKGYDLTTLINEDLLNIHTLDVRNREAVILTKIDQMQLQVVDFSKDYTYEYYISTSEADR